MDLKELNKTLTLLELGEKGNFLSDKYKKVALVLGTTGSGKSTFLQWMFGNNDRLTSIESSDGEFIIIDSDSRISNSTIISKTLFPELIVDQQTDSAYYDCPGFSDTRSPSIDITNSLFIKRITDHATSLKIILTISYPAVRKGVDRVAFLTLVRHTVDFVKNLDHYEKSIGLVVTKIDNEYLRVKGKMKFIDDDEVINKIVKFLQAAKDDIEILKRENVQEEKFYNNAIKLINIILTRKNDEYNKIMLFRRPEEAGPLSGITFMQNAKLVVGNMLNYDISYANINQNHFGYSISDNAKYLISGLSNAVNDQLWTELAEIIKEIEHDSEMSQDIFVQMINTMLKQTNSASHLAKIKTIYNEINTTNDHLNQLLSKNAGAISDISYALKEWKMAKQEEHLTKIRKYNSYLEFFRLVAGKPIKERPWISLIKQATENSARNKKKINEKVIDTLRSMENNSTYNRENLASAFKESLKEKFEKMEIQKSVLEARKQTQDFEKLRENINLPNKEKINNLIIFMNNNNLNTTNIGKVLYKISSDSVKRQFLCSLSPELQQFCVNGDLIDSELIKLALDELYTWHQFLNSLLIEFSKFNFQKNKEDFVQSMGKWGISGKDQGLHISNKNINLLIQKLNDLKIAHPLKLNTILDDEKIDQIGDVLRFTLSSKQVNCNQGKLTIKGNFLLLTDLISSKAICGYGLKQVDMFAIDTIFIDKNINFQGDEIQLNLIAPTWVVHGQVSINLNGAPGTPHSQRVHNNDDGYPGNPGGSAGNFFGLAGTVEGASYLSIYANGGEGGRGQDGAAGYNGGHGRNANNDDSFRREFLYDKKIITIFYNQIVATSKYYGTSGEPGGNGKDGGAGGIGGNKGRVEFIALNSGVPKISTLQGSNGSGGDGGSGGQGGICGDDLLVEECYKQAMGIIYQFGSECGRSVLTCYARASSGSNGRTGRNYKNRGTPRNITFENAASIFTRFKRFVWVQNQLINSKLFELLKFAEKNNDIKTTDLIAIDEYFELEKYGKHMQTENLLFFLQMINNPKYLMASATSCINNLKPNKGVFLPINVQQYLKKLEQNILLTRNSDTNTKKKIVNDLVKNYYDIINKELEIVSIFIDKVRNKLKIKEKTTTTSQNQDAVQEEIKALEVMNLVLNYVDFIRNVVLVVLPGEGKILFNEGKKYESFITYLYQENRKWQGTNKKYTMIKNILSVATRIEETLKAVSQATKMENVISQEIAEWDVQRSLRDINFEMQMMHQDFTANENIIDQLEKLTEIATVLINALNNLEVLKGVKELAVLVTRISNQNIPSLDQSLTINLINNQNQLSFNAVKLHIFPFAQLLLHNIIEPSCSSESPNYQQRLGEVLQRYKSEISQKYIKTGLFISESSFYTWKNEFHKDNIANIFSGQKIFLRANIFSTQSMREATKINTVELFIRSKNKTIENEVNLYLENYDVQATHFGNSHYLFNKTIYLIETDKISIEFSLKKDQFGTPIRKNEAFDQIKRGEIILSPYAMWQFQLIPNEKFKPPEFNHFENDFDLELGGKGTYIELDSLPDLRAEKYYKEMDKRSVVHLIQSDDFIFQGERTRVRRNIRVDNGFEESRKIPNMEKNETGCRVEREDLIYYKQKNTGYEKHATSRGACNSIFFDGVKNYLINTIVESFHWGRSIISNRIDSPTFEEVSFFAEDSINEVSATHNFQLNETLVLGHLIIGSLQKEKKVFNSKSYLSPSNSRNLTGQNLAENVITQIYQAKVKYE